LRPCRSRLDLGPEPLERIAQHGEIDRLGHRFLDFEVERLADAHGLAAHRVIAAADDDDRRLAAEHPEVAQHLDAGVRT
jgi:hypothetical protein